MTFHGDDPQREGNLSADEYRRRAEVRRVEGGACHPPPPEAYEEYTPEEARLLASRPEPVMLAEQAAAYRRFLADGRAEA